MEKKVTHVRKNNDGRWTWKVDGIEYGTNRSGCGMFLEDEYGAFSTQTVGMCDFVACKTVSGMRRKLKRWFGGYEKPVW